MKIISLKTKVVRVGDDLMKVITDALPVQITDGSILAVTSKIVAICEGNVRDSQKFTKKELIVDESEYFFETPAEFTLTIKNNILIPTAGIDESNTDAGFVLWPEDSYESARKIRQYFVDKYKLKNFGVIITDSRTSPLRRGTTGIGIGYAGFQGLNDYRETPDIFGRKLKVTLSNNVDALAVAAVFAMGEGSEQTPIALIEDLPQIVFDEKFPTAEELKELTIPMDEDLYGPLLQGVEWKKGKSVK